MSVDRAILMADVTGSTPLYEKYGDEAASRMVHECVEGMQAIATEGGGDFVRSKGDDVLCLFEDADKALLTTKRILDHGEAGSVSLHAGLHWGTVLWRGDELFGGAVNVAARLSSRATDNEVLMSKDFTDRLNAPSDVDLRPMGEITLKGTALPTSIFGMLATSDDGTTKMISQTQIFDIQQVQTQASATIRLKHKDWERIVAEGQTVTIGRAATCDLVMPDAWVSRIHASVSVHGGMVELTDKSAAGSTLTFGQQEGYFIRRQTVAMNGIGFIELGAPGMNTSLPRIDFTVVKGA